MGWPRPPQSYPLSLCIGCGWLLGRVRFVTLSVACAPCPVLNRFFFYSLRRTASCLAFLLVPTISFVSVAGVELPDCSSRLPLPFPARLIHKAFQPFCPPLTYPTAQKPFSGFHVF
eukprot:RCo045820